MQNSDYNKTIKFGTLTQLACFMFLLKLIEMLWTLSFWSWKGTEPSQGQNFACSDNVGQNIWVKVK